MTNPKAVLLIDCQCGKSLLVQADYASNIQNCKANEIVSKGGAYRIFAMSAIIQQHSHRNEILSSANTWNVTYVLGN